MVQEPFVHMGHDAVNRGEDLGNFSIASALEIPLHPVLLPGRYSAFQPFRVFPSVFGQNRPAPLGHVRHIPVWPMYGHHDNRYLLPVQNRFPASGMHRKCLCLKSFLHHLVKRTTAAFIGIGAYFAAHFPCDHITAFSPIAGSFIILSTHVSVNLSGAASTGCMATFSYVGQPDLHPMVIYTGGAIKIVITQFVGNNACLHPYTFLFPGRNNLHRFSFCWLPFYFLLFNIMI